MHGSLEGACPRSHGPDCHSAAAPAAKECACTAEHAFMVQPKGKLHAFMVQAKGKLCCARDTTSKPQEAGQFESLHSCRQTLTICFSQSHLLVELLLVKSLACNKHQQPQHLGFAPP
eukprot:1160891-Pelagomonas_calceolata.AAC.5